jgi:hypothetical protein
MALPGGANPDTQAGVQRIAQRATVVRFVAAADARADRVAAPVDEGPGEELDMQWKKLVTLTFDENVGSRDRVLRLGSGIGLVALGSLFGLPMGASVAMTVFGVMWTATAVLSKCSIYYALGYSTCPVAPKTERWERPAA